MMPTIAPPSVLSAPQRRCQVLLTLFQPEPIATVEIFSALNGVDDDTAREDITETSLEIQRYHRLAITTCQNGCYRIEGTALDQRLCLLHCSGAACVYARPSSRKQFTPALKNALKQRGIARPLYDDINLHALINLCARRLQNHLNIATCSSCVSFYSIVCYNTMLASPRNSTLCSRFGRSRARNIHSPRKLVVTGSAT
ncbi:stationary phase inducible protein CsiE [Salmonella enterica subsp. enterica]|uniref:Stationary phase inducible protein CsiE n=1 Tax=Salmonella enterica I TaxID=59201 RepID=A0A3S4EY79_SALET|nr:stationary phase inducible protein CsiE [Salmonella enterica subsp. enterica]